MYNTEEYQPLPKGFYKAKDSEIFRDVRNKSKRSRLRKKTKEGVVVSIDIRKYDRKFETIGKIQEHTLNGKELLIQSELVLDDKHKTPTIRIALNHHGKQVGTFGMSNKQVSEFCDFIYDFFVNKEDIKQSIENVTTFSNDQKLILALLKDRDYNVSVTHLEEFDIKIDTARAMLKSSVKRGFLQECGKIGKKKLYTCTIPKEKLKQMFGG